jgi:hypothetical protein
VTRRQLEHVIRAAADIAEDDEIVVLGSQAILGQVPAAPAELLVSTEADVYPRNHPERTDLIDGSIGEGSPFHDTYGYYARGVGETTAVLPNGWQDRLVRVCNANTRGATGSCVEVHDLVLAKLVAGRDKDLRFARDVARHRPACLEVLLERVDWLPVSAQVQELVRGRVLAVFRCA